MEALTALVALYRQVRLAAPWPAHTAALLGRAAAAPCARRPLPPAASCTGASAVLASTQADGPVPPCAGAGVTCSAPALAAGPPLHRCSSPSYLPQFTFRLAPGQLPLKVETRLTMAPARGIRVTVHRRG